MSKRTCRGTNDRGQHYRQAPLKGGDHCFWHSSEHSEEAAKARKLGGLTRRKEKAVCGAFDLKGIETAEQVRRILEIALMDTLSLENSIPRSRTLAYLVVVALKILEASNFEWRLDDLDETFRPQTHNGE